MVAATQGTEGAPVSLEAGLAAVTQAAFGLPSDSSPAPDGEAVAPQGDTPDSLPGSQEPFVEGEVEEVAEPRVPLERLAKETQKKQDYAAQLAEAQRELRELKAAQQASQEPRLDGEVLDNGKVAVDPAVLDRVRTLAIQDHVQQTYQANGDQAKAIADVWQMRDGAVSVSDAYLIAKSQNPDLFAPTTEPQEQQVAPNPSVQVNRPGPSRVRQEAEQPKKSLTEQRVEAFQSVQQRGGSSFEQVQQGGQAWAAWLRENNIL